MNQRIVHRGPDDGGTWLRGNIGLAMRRLSIIDVAGGHQPVCNEDETVWIVFNGEIYNHQQLRRDLEQRGHHYRSRSDTETIVHLYEEYGRECVRHLRGMFAFAIWDSRLRRLFIARDRLGIKPLYYRFTGPELLFASEIKALLAGTPESPRFNIGALSEYLAFGYLSGDETMFSGIRKLMPGHWMEVDESGKLKIEQYWDLPATQPDESKTSQDYAHEYRDLLEQAITSHLMSDVPLGVFLSGGADSSAVAALMARQVPEGIKTFSVGYAETEYSELDHARAMAAHIRSDHHEVLVTREDFFSALPRLIWHEDEPIVWPSSVSLYFVAELARKHVKVVLTGEGSDETLAGYGRYAFTLLNTRLDHVYRIVPRGLRSVLRRHLQHTNLLGASARRKLAHSFAARDGDSWTSFYFDNFLTAFSEADQATLLTENARKHARSAYGQVMEIWGRSSGSLLQRMLYTDIKSYLVELLMKQDNMSMAASLESRVPFLDHVLVEYTTRIPARHNIRGLSGKHVLKQAMRGIVPDDVLYRQKKGFPTPMRSWLAGSEVDRVHEMLLSSRSLDRGLFQAETLAKLVDQHRSGRVDHTDRIWRLLNLELWQRVFLDGERSWEPAPPCAEMTSGTT